MIMRNPGKYFTWSEVTVSYEAARKGINNSLPDELRANAFFAASRMDYVRIILGVAILVGSWYRCLKLNRALKSKDDSDHLLALGIDFTAPDFGTPVEICKYLLQYKDTLNWKQLILEHTWVHISFHESMEIPAKREVLTLLANGKYAIGLTDKLGNPL